MLCRDKDGCVRIVIVSLAVLSLTVGLVAVITPGWYIYEGKLVNYDMKMVLASKMFSENIKQMKHQEHAGFDSESESMQVTDAARHMDNNEPTKSTDFSSGQKPANGHRQRRGHGHQHPPPPIVSGPLSDKLPAGKDTTYGDQPDTPRADSGTMSDDLPTEHENDGFPPRPAFTDTDGAAGQQNSQQKRPESSNTDNLLPPPVGQTGHDNSNNGKVPSRPIPPGRPGTSNSDEAQSNSNHAHNQGGMWHTSDNVGQHPGMTKDDAPSRPSGMDTDIKDDNTGENHADNAGIGNNDEGGAANMPMFRPPIDPKPRPTLLLNQTRPTRPTRSPIGGPPPDRTWRPPNRPGIILPSRIPPPKFPLPFNRTQSTSNRPDLILPSRMPPNIFTLPFNKTRRPSNKPGIILSTIIPPIHSRLPPLNISLPKDAIDLPPVGSPRPQRPTKTSTDSGLQDSLEKSLLNDVKGKTDWLAGVAERLTGFDMKPDWLLRMLKQMKGGDISDNAMHEIERVEYSVHLGLWFGKLCEQSSGEETCEGEKLSILFGKLKTPDVSLSTWNDLRLESSLSLVFRFLGVLGTVLTVKPLCLKTKPRIPVTIAVAGLLLSCVLSITAIARISSIHTHVNDILEDKHASHDLPPGMPITPCHLSTPWSVVLCGIGAGLALITILTLGLFIWRQERQRWYRFSPDVDLANNDANKEVYTDISGSFGQNNKAFEPAIGNSKV